MKYFGAWVAFACFAAGGVLVGIEQGWMTGLGLCLIAFGIAPSRSSVIEAPHGGSKSG